MRIILISFLSISLSLVGCGINPVTGKRQITLMSQADEIDIGKQHYIPSQQSQGGSYIVDPNLNKYVNRVGQSVAKHSAQPDLPYEFVVLNTSAPNAWALPGGKIAINRGLLLIMEDEAQLAAVLAHEVVHAAARHSAESRATSTGIGILNVLLQTQTNNALYRQGANFGGGAIQAHYGRDNEFEADYYGIDYMVAAGYSPQGAVELQQIFLDLSKDTKKAGWLDQLFATHPPSAERLERNRAHASSFPEGKRNRAAYQNAIKQLKQDQAAYELNDKAVAEANNKEWDKALGFAQQAIKKQPREARFHITHGRILDAKGDNKAAINAFNRAHRLEPGYFASHIYRGISHHKNKRYELAYTDLTEANKLLETGAAYYYLGEGSEARGQRDQAVGFYRNAVQAGGKVGQAATERLQKMGIK